MYKIQSDGTNTSVASISRSSAGTVTKTLDLRSLDNGTVKIISRYTTVQGAEGQRTKTFGVVDVSSSGPTLLGALDGLEGLLPSGDREPFTLALALVVSILGTAGISSQYRLSSESVGVVAIGFLLAFGILGYLSYDLLFVAIVAFGALAFLRRAL